MTDYVRHKGAAAFGTRLRRLSERLDRQVQALYREHDSAFQPRWFAVVGALREKGVLSVGELAGLLGITHAAVSQLRGELIKAGLVQGKSDPADGRRQMLELSAAGKRTVSQLQPLWAAIAAATEALCADVAPNLLRDLGRIEDAVETKSIAIRTAEILAASRAAKD
ncbi:MAG TPA: MarR family transcriptional regulator [Rhizomicrobium sp.]|jgi:DNA-binding MarR family transcriptional regulator|nr:MarR family transcriptional regulator [Rhizomicrobium sp.]